MLPLLNPLTKAAIDSMDGLPEPAGGPRAEELERRAQELLNEWLKIYFGGVAFDTRGATGNVISMSFPPCDLLFGQAAPPQPSERPLLHVLSPEIRPVSRTRGPEGYWTHEETWTYRVLVRTASQTPADPALTGGAKDSAVREASRVNREVASNLNWLLSSGETLALAVKGIGNIVVIQPPAEIPAGGWHLRQLTFTTRVFHKVPG